MTWETELLYEIRQFWDGWAVINYDGEVIESGFRSYFAARRWLESYVQEPPS